MINGGDSPFLFELCAMAVMHNKLLLYFFASFAALREEWYDKPPTKLTLTRVNSILLCVQNQNSRSLIEHLKNANDIRSIMVPV